MRRYTFLPLNVLGIGLLLSHPAMAAFDVWVDFDNTGPQINTPLGVLDSMDTSIFPGLNNTTDRTAVEPRSSRDSIPITAAWGLTSQPPRRPPSATKPW